MLVVGRYKLLYEADTGSPASNLIKIIILVNSTISDAQKVIKFVSCDLKDFFLASPMAQPDYIKVPIKYFPEDITSKYNLRILMNTKGTILVKIKKRTYG